MTFLEYLNANPIARGLAGRNLMLIDDLSSKEIKSIIDLAISMKTEVISREEQLKILPGQTLAEIFEKPSLRTRISFETGIYQLGGQGIYIGAKEIQIGVRESIHDISNVISRMADIMMARTFSHDTVAGLAKYSQVPVINGLCDTEHPCQALADIQTVIEHKGWKPGLNFVYIGDGNNVCQSLMIICSKLGINFTCASPVIYSPNQKYIDRTKELAQENNSKFILTDDPIAAVKDADIVYTDTWTSMGQEEETQKREKDFADYQINAQLMSYAKSDAIFMHCLPAHRNHEVTDEVIDSPQSVIFDEAENRLHAQKAVMALLGNKQI